mmetsp:Transcript_34322/g.85018  ORF Transcript_34322/g.85018 Transcript_34322/m.85018 type:complete len:358 (-) Transcript_34322:57-1130(-)
MSSFSASDGTVRIAFTTSVSSLGARMLSSEATSELTNLAGDSASFTTGAMTCANAGISKSMRSCAAVAVRVSGLTAGSISPRREGRVMMSPSSSLVLFLSAVKGSAATRAVTAAATPLLSFSDTSPSRTSVKTLEASLTGMACVTDWVKASMSGGDSLGMMLVSISGTTSPKPRGFIRSSAVSNASVPATFSTICLAMLVALSAVREFMKGSMNSANTALSGSLGDCKYAPMAAAAACVSTGDSCRSSVSRSPRMSREDLSGLFSSSLPTRSSTTPASTAGERRGPMLLMIPMADSRSPPARRDTTLSLTFISASLSFLRMPRASWRMSLMVGGSLTNSLSWTAAICATPSAAWRPW